MKEPTREEIGDLLRRLVDTVVEMKDRVEELEAQLATTPSPEAVAKAALKWAVRKIEDESNHQNDVWIDACEHVAFEIGFAATDTDTIAAIIKTAGGKKDDH